MLQRRLAHLHRSSVSWTAATTALASGLSLLSSPLLARAVGASGRGDVAAVIATVTFLSWAGFAGAPFAAGFFGAGGRRASTTVLAMASSVIGVALAAVVWLLAPVFAAGHSSEVITGLRICGLLLPLIGVGLCGQELLYASDRLGAWNVLRAIPLVGPALAIVVLYVADALTTSTAVLANVASLAVYAVIGTLIGVRWFGRVNGLSDLRLAREVLTYAGARWAAITSQGLLMRLDQLLMVPLSTPAELGRYAIAVTIVASANMLSGALGTVMYGRVRNADTSEVMEMWRRARRRTLWLSTAVGLIVVATGPVLIPFIFGPDFGGLLPVLIPLAVAQVLNDRWIVDSNVHHALGRSSKTLAPSWLAVAVAGTALLAFGSDDQLSAVEAAVSTGIASAVRAAAFRVRPAQDLSV